MTRLLLVGFLGFGVLGCGEGAGTAERFCNVTVTNGSASVTACVHLTCATTTCRVRNCGSFSSNTRTAAEVDMCIGQAQGSADVTSASGVPGEVTCFSADASGAAVCDLLLP